jgi:hypothetical protein
MSDHEEVVRLATADMQEFAAKEKELATLRTRVPKLEQEVLAARALAEEWKRQADRQTQGAMELNRLYGKALWENHELRVALKSKMVKEESVTDSEPHTAAKRI